MEVLTIILLHLYLMVFVTLVLTVLNLDIFISWIGSIVHFRQKWLGERIVFDIRRLSIRDSLTNPRTVECESTKAKSIDTSEQV